MVVDAMEEFVLNFYSYEYSGNPSIADNEDDDEDDDDYQAIITDLACLDLKLKNHLMRKLLS